MSDIEHVQRSARYLRWWQTPPLDQAPTIGLLADKAIRDVVAFVESEAGLGESALPVTVDQVAATELSQATQVRASAALAECVRWLTDGAGNWGWFEHYQPDAAALLRAYVSHVGGQR